MAAALSAGENGVSVKAAKGVSAASAGWRQRMAAAAYQQMA